MADIKKLIFFDTETTTQYKDIKELEANNPIGYKLFVKRFNNREMLNKIGDVDTAYIQKAPLFAEYNKVICVSIGMFSSKTNKFVIKSFKDDNEENLIRVVHDIFVNNLSSHFQAGYGIAGCNIKGFDIPVLNKKFLKYGLEIPKCFKTFNIKPWEMNVFDLFEAWKSNGIDLASLEEICVDLEVENSKTILEDKTVYELYHIENNLDLISKYCDGDVFSTYLAAEKICNLI